MLFNIFRILLKTKIYIKLFLNLFLYIIRKGKMINRIYVAWSEKPEVVQIFGREKAVAILARSLCGPLDWYCQLKINTNCF